MMKKRRWVVTSVTMYEALLGCIYEGCPAICIEEPLYHGIQNCLYNIDGIKDYEIMRYDQEELIILKKVQGADPFDDEHFQVYHYLLHGL